MSTTAHTSRKGSPIPGVAFLAIATAVVVLIALLPRTGDQPPPPTVAEFAPQAAKQIRKALSSQASQFGNGPGSCAADQSCPGGKKKPEPTRPVRRVPDPNKHCIGDPPRQIEDPQSPPCVAVWDGDNGGATTLGVTANQINIALPLVPFEDESLIRLLAEFFNQRFQFYRRKINIVRINQSVLNGQPDTDKEIADAQAVKAIPAFASLTYAGQFGAEHTYYDALARDHIISVAHRAGSKTSESYLRQFAPYRWTVLPGIDTMQRELAEMVCKVLSGRAPEYAGPGIGGSTRVFGLIYGRASDGSAPDLSLFRAAVQACHAAPAVDVEFQESRDATTNNSNATNAMLKMAQAKVTSVVCFCDNPDVSGPLMSAASGEQFRPEWVLSTYIDNDTDNAYSQAPPDQSAHVIGASFRNRWLPRAQMPWFWAIKEAGPGADPPNAAGYYLAARYSSLLLLASGIQLAGPNLTPESFQRGLQEAQFPNPGAGAAPYYQARVGFEGSHTMIHDATMYWYSSSDRGTVDPASLGAICYVAQGRRYRAGAWPTAPQQFQATCRSG